MTATFPQATNVRVPTHGSAGEATDALVADFSRNPNRFAVNKYAQIVPTKFIRGYFMQMTVEEAGRVLSSDADEYKWVDGADSPQGLDGQESFNWLPYECVRRAPAFRIGTQTAKNASWEVIAQHARIHAQKAMTIRTMLAINALTNQSNYSADHILDVTGVESSGGNWRQSTHARQTIKRSMTQAMQQIWDSTLAAVETEDMVLVINDALAGEIAASNELTEYIKGSPFAAAQIRGEVPNFNEEFGLPEKLYGVTLVVEKTRRVTSKKGATRAVSRVLPNATPVLCSRPGGLVGTDSAPTFSSCAVFVEEEMNVQLNDDEWHRRTTGRITDTVAAKVVAPISAVLFTNAI